MISFYILSNAIWVIHNCILDHHQSTTNTSRIPKMLSSMDKIPCSANCFFNNATTPTVNTPQLVSDTIRDFQPSEFGQTLPARLVIYFVCQIYGLSVGIQEDSFRPEAEVKVIGKAVRVSYGKIGLREKIFTLLAPRIKATYKCFLSIFLRGSG